MPNSFSPSRLTFARERRGFQKQELAAKLDVSAVAVSQWENGERAVSEEKQTALSKVLGFPREFFAGADLPLLDGARFRSLARMTAWQQKTAVRAAGQALAIDRWIEENFERPATDIPEFRGENPETAATLVRDAWGLGSGPLPNLVHTLERHGVRVYSLVNDGKEVDALSVWYDGRPFVFLNTQKTPERSRMDAAHELGHLVLHRTASDGESREEEKEAKQFAMAFLLPADAVRATVPRRLTVDNILAEKVRWGVSAMAYIRRLFELGRLADYSYRRLCIAFRSAGASHEPGRTIQREHSQMLGKVLSSQAVEGLSVRAALARDLHFPLTDIDDATFGLRVSAISGGSSSAPEPTADTGKLTLVR